MFSKKSIPAEPLFSGHMQLTGVTYDQNLEDTNSKEFQDLAAKLESDVSTKPLQNNGLFLPFVFFLIIYVLVSTLFLLTISNKGHFALLSC